MSEANEQRESDSGSSPCSADEPDNRGPAVVAMGSPIGGYELTGPFDTVDEAVKWASKHSLPGILGVANQSVMLLKEPDYRNGPGIMEGIPDNRSVKVPTTGDERRLTGDRVKPASL